MADAGQLLLLRRAGALWGIASGAVLSLRRGTAGYRIVTGGSGAKGALLADEVLGVVAGLAVRPIAPVVRRFWPEAAGGRGATVSGLAVYGNLPVLVVNPEAPPGVLAAPAAAGGEVQDGE